MTGQCEGSVRWVSEARPRGTTSLTSASLLLTRRLPNVGTEMSLHVLAYNLKRVINILGIAKTMKAVRLAGA